MYFLMRNEKIFLNFKQATTTRLYAAFDEYRLGTANLEKHPQLGK